MGEMASHVGPGLGILVMGFWHLLNHIKLHVQNPKTYHSLPWFPTTKIRYFELYSIMVGCSMYIIQELFGWPPHHLPVDTDGTIPSTRLPNFEHSCMVLTLLVYACFAILLDKFVSIAQYELTQLLLGIVFGQELLLFHLHSTDHTGVEGQYHMLLQLLILICFITTLMAIGYQKSFVVNFIRSISIFFQGLWLMVIGFMLWTKSFIPKGCFLNQEIHRVVRCHGEEALHRAKSLVNIEFSLYLICVTIFAISLYLAMHKIYEEKMKYQTLTKRHQEQLHEDIEAPRKLEESQSFLLIEKSFSQLNMEHKS
ncbi:hypothetical protein LXL04_009813 [Taraxacum kok-saghyz]